MFTFRSGETSPDGGAARNAGQVSAVSHLAVVQNLVDLCVRLSGDDDSDLALEGFLCELSRLLGAHGAYVVQWSAEGGRWSEAVLHTTHAWTDGLGVLGDRLEGQPVARFRDWVNALRSGRLVQVGEEGSGRPEIRFLRRVGVGGALLVPIDVGKEPVGFLLIEDAASQSRWREGETSLFDVVARVIGIALERHNTVAWLAPGAPMPTTEPTARERSHDQSRAPEAVRATTVLIVALPASQRRRVAASLRRRGYRVLYSDTFTTAERALMMPGAAVDLLVTLKSASRQRAAEALARRSPGLQLLFLQPEATEESVSTPGIEEDG